MYSVLILFLFLFIISLSLTVYILTNFSKLEAARRLRTLAGQEKTYESKEETVKMKRGGGKSNLIQLIGKLMPLDKYLEDKKLLIIKARLLIKPEEFLSISIIAAIVAMMLMHLIFSNVLLDLVAMVIGFKLPLIYVRRIKKKRSDKLGDQLPDALNIISNGLRAGLSFVQAIMVAGKEMDAPIADDFKKIIRDNLLGKELEDSLTEFAEKEDNENIEMLVSAILIQRQVGGNLSEILDNISTTIRDRIKLRGDIKTMTAQSKMSAGIIAAIPAMIILALNVLNKGFMEPLFTTLIGNIILGIAVAMQVTGILVIVKLLNVKV